MNKHVAIVVDWYGPYSLDEARKAAKDDFSEGLYILIGKVKYQKKSSELQYVGIAKDLSSRIGNGHHKIFEIPNNCTVWLGEVASFGIPGKKEKVVDSQLDLAEWLHSYFLELPFNVRKKENPPDTPATVLNRWWFTDYEKPRQRRPHHAWPDIIDFAGKEYGAKVVWFGGQVVKWVPEDF